MSCATLNRPYRRVLAVAAGADACDPIALRMAVAAGAAHAARERLGLTVLATFSPQALWRLLCAGASAYWATPCMPSDEELQAEAEGHVMAILTSVSADVPLSWRCLPEPTGPALARDLTAMPDALVIVGCSGTLSSRRLSRRLTLAARRHGSQAMILAPEIGEPQLSAPVSPAAGTSRVSAASKSQRNI